MESDMNGSILGEGVSNMNVTMETDVEDVRTLAKSYLIFKIGK